MRLPLKPVLSMFLSFKKGEDMLVLSPQSPGDVSLDRIIGAASRVGGLVEPKNLYHVKRHSGVTEMVSDNVAGKPEIVATGTEHFLWRGYGSKVSASKISVKGKRNTVFFGAFSKVIEADIRVSGEDAVFYFGAFTTDQSMTIVVEGPGEIVIGDDCMLSKRIMIDRSDHHSIFDVNGKRINLDADILIQRHVWLGRDVKVGKGSSIGAGTVVGQSSVVSREVEPDCIYAGMPAKRIKHEVSWHRVKAPTKERADASRRHQTYLKNLLALEQRIASAR